MDFKEIKELIRVFDKSDLNQLKVKDGDFGISMAKGVGAQPLITTTQAVPVSATPSVVETSTVIEDIKITSNDTINAPMVGTYYSSPSPESPTFVKVGDTVSKGQTLCILEAMKIMNEVEAEYDCKIVKILVENGSPVEFDMPLFEIEKL